MQSTPHPSIPGSLKQIRAVGSQNYLSALAMSFIAPPPPDRYAQSVKYQGWQAPHYITVQANFRFFQQQRASCAPAVPRIDPISLQSTVGKLVFPLPDIIGAPVLEAGFQMRLPTGRVSLESNFLQLGHNIGKRVVSYFIQADFDVVLLLVAAILSKKPLPKWVIFQRLPPISAPKRTS